MSQLDSQNKNVVKKTFFTLLIFSVICIGITVACIYNTITLKKEDDKQGISLQNNIDLNEEIKEKGTTVKKLKLTDKYFSNGITTETRNISIGDIIYQSENYTQRELEINYIMISGLKNPVIEEKINKDIENKVLSLRNDAELQETNVESIGINAYLSANFSDVISVVITKYVEKQVNGQSEYEYDYHGLNYSLKDGEIIQFNDLFTEDASIKTIITQSVYDNLAIQYAYSSDTLEADMDQINYGEIENKIFKVLSKYNKNPNFNFYFSPSTISFVDEDMLYSIDMANFYESIAIYTKYKMEDNLYQDEESVKCNSYVFSTIDMNEVIFDNANKTDNFYYRIINTSGHNIESAQQKEVEKNVQDTIYKKINEYAIIANKNKEKGYIFDIIYYTSEYNGKINYHYDGYLCSMDRIFYNENLDELLAFSMREETTEIWARDFSWVDQENVTFEESISRYVEDYTNPIELEQVTTREDRERMQEEFQY